MSTDDARDLLRALHRPFPRNTHKQKQGMTYVPGEWYVLRLNQIATTWDFRKIEERIEPIKVRRKNKDTGQAELMAIPCRVVTCELTIPGLGTRSGTGVQMLEDNAGEDVFKGAETDALKRCCMLFGMGLHLYFPNQQLPAIEDAPLPQSQRQVDPSTGEIADGGAPRSAEDAPGSTEGRIGTPDTPTPPPGVTAPQGVTPGPEWETVNKALHAEARKHKITHEHLKARAIAGARAHGRMITSLKELAPIALKGMLDAIKRDPADWKKRAEVDLNDPAIHSAVYPDREEEMF